MKFTCLLNIAYETERTAYRFQLLFCKPHTDISFSKIKCNSSTFYSKVRLSVIKSHQKRSHYIFMVPVTLEVNYTACTLCVPHRIGTINADVGGHTSMPLLPSLLTLLLSLALPGQRLTAMSTRNTKSI